MRLNGWQGLGVLALMVWFCCTSSAAMAEPLLLECMHDNSNVPLLVSVDLANKTVTYEYAGRSPRLRYTNEITGADSVAITFAHRFENHLISWGSINRITGDIRIDDTMRAKCKPAKPTSQI
jgi:hypothetical protein